MHPGITIRDWTYVTLVAVALITYGLGLVSKSTAAQAPERDAVHVCVLSDANVKAN
jgi:hypothetical protein